MSKLYRKHSGWYYFEDNNGDTISIFRIDYNLWGWNINSGMTKGTFKTLREAKKYFGFIK